MQELIKNVEKGKATASKALIDNERTEIRFFSFPKDGSISKEIL